MKFLATCVPGLERLLTEELEELDISLASGDETATPGSVAFEGNWNDAARVLTFSRIASRVLLQLRSFAAKNAEMLYDQVRRVRWTEFVHPDRTMAVFCHGVGSENLVLSFAALKIKDAVCDEVRKHNMDRPNIDREDPDIRLEAHFYNGRCQLSLDLGGAPLHRRGERQQTGAAPLRENRAAALLRLMGLRAGAEGDFVDPFCGSGTILLEAAAIAANRAPGLARRVEDFAGARAFNELESALYVAREEAEDNLGELKLRLEGRDVESRQLEAAKKNLRGAAKLVRADFRETDLKADWVATNPPHGIRIGDVKKSSEMIALLTRKLKSSDRPSKLGLALAAGPLETAVGLRPTRKVTVENGPEKLRLLAYEIRPFKRKADDAETA